MTNNTRVRQGSEATSGTRPYERNFMHRRTPGSTAIILVGIWSLLISLVAGSTHAAEAFSHARVAVYFSPSGGATDAVVRELTAAKAQVLIQAYSFTSVPIAKALVEAHKRGVEILAVLDKSNETQKYSAATFLNNAGIQPLIDDQHAIAHAKVMVIDSTSGRRISDRPAQGGINDATKWHTSVNNNNAQ
jgi:phosphatidylserine/phosphatidylglycerophosphate/cardiolipin synthase-like enzyme